MKLRSKHVFLFYDSRKSAAVFAFRNRRGKQRHAVRMREIDECAVGNSAQQARRTIANLQTIPSHMRRLYSGREAAAFSWPERQAVNFRRLFTRCQHPLHPDTYSQERNSVLDSLDYGFAQSGIIQGLCGSEVTNPRQNDFFCQLNFRDVRSNHRLRAKMVKGLLYGRQIARLVINDCDHNKPFVLGSSRAICLSCQHAARNARANALNSASIL